MNTDPRSAPWLRRLLLYAALGLASSLPVHADPVAAPQSSPLPPATEGADEVLIMVCRRGLDDLGPSHGQELPQELPLLCLVTAADAQAVQMGPARFHELLDKAARAGRLSVVVLRPT